MHVRCDNQYKTGADRGYILGQPRLFECMGICVLSPAHESDMRGYLVYGGFLKTFLEGSIDHIIYRDYIVNGRFLIYCSLVTVSTTSSRGTTAF